MATRLEESVEGVGQYVVLNFVRVPCATHSCSHSKDVIGDILCGRPEVGPDLVGSPLRKRSANTICCCRRSTVNIDSCDDGCGIIYLLGKGS